MLIPGFAGFDALGQLEYYAGVTPIFGARGDAVIHYFDNIPTAAVVARAARLQAYLAKRIARGEIQDGDEITLIGHSTGGLDLRRLIVDLYQRPTDLFVDGGVRVKPDALLRAIGHVVFLSVPQWGTNIADWVRAHPVWRELAVAQLRAVFAGSRLPVVDRLSARMTAAIARLTRSGLFLAVQDCLREADPRWTTGEYSRRSEAFRAASQLELYLRQIAFDFRGIDDLTARPPDGDRASPAHFPPEERERELRMWEDLRIQVRSYATLGPRPFRFEPGRPAPEWFLANPFETALLAKPSGKTDLVYRVCYRACAGGPFASPAGVPWPVECWDNDGIVNTASMVWPLGDSILLEADHMDIVGHFASIRSAEGAVRTRRAYDLLGSGSAFDGARFQQLWDEIFAWATATESAAGARMSPGVG